MSTHKIVVRRQATLDNDVSAAANRAVVGNNDKHTLFVDVQRFHAVESAGVRTIDRGVRAGEQ